MKRFVWNYYNRVEREMYVTDATTSWNYSTATYRQANANSANQVDFVIGIAEDACEFGLMAGATTSASTLRRVYSVIGIDSTTGPYRGVCALIVNNSQIGTGFTSLRTVLAAGHHYAAWVEAGAGTDTQTFFSSAGAYAWLEGTVMG